MAPSIFINCDMGEIQATWDSGRDKTLLDYVDAVNVSCGEHAGNSSLITNTIQYAIKKGVRIGAHPSYPDRENFGRKVMRISSSELKKSLIDQIGYIKNLVELNGGSLHHVKPHGALYNEAAENEDVAKIIAEAILKIDDNLILFGLAQSKCLAEYRKLGLTAWQEVFADRAYEKDGNLRKRNLPGALIHKPQNALSQVSSIFESGLLVSYSGEVLKISGDTFCVHGDAENALEITKALKEKFSQT